MVAQQDRLLNMRIDDQLDQDTFARQHTELRDPLASINIQLDVLDRAHDEKRRACDQSVLNSLKPSANNGFRPITPLSGEFSKSSV